MFQSDDQEWSFGSDRFVLVTPHCIPQHNATLKSHGAKRFDEEEIEDDQEQEKASAARREIWSNIPLSSPTKNREAKGRKPHSVRFPSIFYGNIP